MARKITPKPTSAKMTRNPQLRRAIDDNFVAPKRKPKTEKVVTFAEALAEAGQTVEELKVLPKAERTAREPGTSNLANTIRAHRGTYATMLRGNKKTQNNGDAVAVLLLPIPFDDLQAYAHSRFGKTYDHLNPGHARMCIGNLIRAAVKKNEEGVLEWLKAQQPKVEA